jgi:hypothetical protein
MHNAVSLIKQQVLLLECNRSQHNDMPRAFMIRGSNPSGYMRPLFPRSGSVLVPTQLPIHWISRGSFPRREARFSIYRIFCWNSNIYLTAYTSAMMEPLQCRRCIHLNNTLGQELCNSNKFSCWKIPPPWVLGFLDFEGAHNLRKVNALTQHYIQQSHRARSVQLFIRVHGFTFDSSLAVTVDFNSCYDIYNIYMS